jgi:uncharacterized protein YhbP (UPF0306 family)
MPLKQLIEDYLKKAKLMQIATTKNSKPWAASAWYVHDEDLNLYFISRKKRRHSLELGENPNVAGTITIPHTKGSGEKVRGLQFEGKAQETTGKILKKARELYFKKYPLAEKIPLARFFIPTFIATFYIIRPSLIVLYDEVNFPKNPQQELILKK